MTVDDVIRLSKAGLSDDMIIQQIKKKGQPFDLTTDQLVQLKSASVSERVIQAMIDPARETAPHPTDKNPGEKAVAAVQSPPVQPLATLAPDQQREASASLPTEIGLYAKQRGQWVEVLPDVVNWKTGGVVKNVASLGVVKGDLNGNLNGAQSRNSLATPL